MRARLVGVVVSLMLLAAPAAAQGAGQGGGQGGRGMGGGQGGERAQQMQQRQNEMLFRGITLSETQRAAVDSIQAAGRERMRAAMQGGGGMQDPQARERMQTMRQEQMAAIRRLLTPEQQAQFDKNQQEMPQPGQGRRPPRR